MKKSVLLSILIALSIIAGYKAFKATNPDTGISTFFNKAISQFKRTPKVDTRDTPRERVALYFKDGSTIEGELIEEKIDNYIVNWRGTEFIVYKNQIESLKRGKEILEDKAILSDEEIIGYWPYKNNIVIRLTNRQVLDAKISKVEDEKVTLLYALDKGGYIEQEIERNRIEYLIFKPLENEESRKIEANLKEFFPDMKFYKEGGFTIVTDSYDTWVNKYKNTLRETYTSIYLKFFDLFKGRSPKVDNFVVIFDDYNDFFEYAIADGVPGWAVAGYFSPTQEVLYLFNVLGEKFSEILFEGLVGESGRRIDDIVEKVEENIDKRYHIFFEGQVKTLKDKFWEAYSYYKGMYRESTMETLRHEFAHEVFHNWGLQGIELSKFERNEDALIKKKKEFLEAKDYKKKARLIRALIALKEGPLDMRAANSWLAEGVATYCETSTIGVENDRWLYIYQEMARKGPIYPLESLTYYKIGSFPGVASSAMLQMYAQSWAFVDFLMAEYPKEFMEYQRRMAEETAKENQDIEWLSEAIGKDIKTIEKELVEYMSRYEEVDDPYIRHFDKLLSIMRN